MHHPLKRALLALALSSCALPALAQSMPQTYPDVNGVPHTVQPTWCVSGCGGGSAPSAATGSPAATTRSPASYKDTVTGAEDPAIGTAAGGQQVQSSTIPFRYQVAGAYGGSGLSTSTAGVVGSAVGPLYSERSYSLRVAGTLASGDSLQWQGLAADGVTWVPIGSAITALPNSFAMVAPAVPAGTAANLRLVKTGTGSDTLWASAD